MKWKEKSEREGTVWEEECNVDQRVWLSTKGMHRQKEEKKTKLKRCGSSSAAWVGPKSFEDGEAQGSMEIALPAACWEYCAK